MQDQLGHNFSSVPCPKRVVSLVPSLTEFLADGGLGERLVGLTKFCVKPEGLKAQKQIIGGTKQVKIDKLKALQPDLVIANKEENTLEDITAIKEFCPVWVTDIKNPSDAFKAMHDLTTFLELDLDVGKIESSFSAVQWPLNLGTALYLIWRNPYMSAGGDTFISSMLEQAGFQNVLQKSNRYPTLSEDEIVELNPTHVLLSSEPFPFKEKHIQELKVLLPEANIQLVDGEMFSWYGTRMTYFNSYVNSHLLKFD